MKQTGLSGEKPLGENKTKAPNSDYHKDEPPVAARQAEVARGYLKTDELNGHPPSEGYFRRPRPREQITSERGDC